MRIGLVYIVKEVSLSSLIEFLDLAEFHFRIPRFVFNFNALTQSEKFRSGIRLNRKTLINMF